jgi:hypothetical protein
MGKKVKELKTLPNTLKKKGQNISQTQPHANGMKIKFKAYFYLDQIFKK